MVEVKDLCFSYDGQNQILNHLNVRIQEKKITTLLGANGCGKTTLLQLLTKNLKPGSGSIQIDGVDLDQVGLKDFARTAAIVHQKNTAPEDLTVERLVGYGRLPYSSIFRVGMDEYSQKIVDKALELTNLTHLRERRIGTLSGGQRQRAFIAMALAQDTKVLFLDEPTTYLDVRYQVEILRLVEKLNREEGMTIVMVLHDINQALAYSHEIIGLHNGTVALQGAPEEVITSESIRMLYGIDLPVVRAEGKLCVLAV